VATLTATMSAIDPEIEGEARIRAVFSRVRQGDLSVADLYAEDAVLTYSGGGRVVGRAAIRAFYQQQIESIRPQPHVTAVLRDPPLYVAVIEAPTSEGHYRALDLFEVDDSGIRRLEIYSQGQASGRSD
jgi:hypothetical protein